jgi:hypothetical protein
MRPVPSKPEVWSGARAYLQPVRLPLSRHGVEPVLRVRDPAALSFLSTFSLHSTMYVGYRLAVCTGESAQTHCLLLFCSSQTVIVHADDSSVAELFFGFIPVRVPSGLVAVCLLFCRFPFSLEGLGPYSSNAVLSSCMGHRQSSRQHLCARHVLGLCRLVLQVLQGCAHVWVCVC